MEGADYARIFLQNDPRSFVKISKTRDFWMTRLKSTACSAAWAVQWEVGPFSEAASGNAGGWVYVPGCGTALACLNNPKYPNPPINNTGWVDWVMGPLGGMRRSKSGPPILVSVFTTPRKGPK